MFEALNREFRPMFELAWPLVLANLGWMSMGIVDTIMVGRVGPEAIGAVSLGGTLFITVGLFGGGLLLGLDTVVPQAFGAGRVGDCHRSLLNSFYVGLALSPVLMGIVWLLIPFLRSFGINPAVLGQAIPYLKAVAWSTLPLLLYFAFRGYLQGMNLVRPITFALLSANLVNIAGNWIFVYGHCGVTAMGAEGSGWATTISRVYMVVVLLGYVLYYDCSHRTGLAETPLRPNLARIRQLVVLGFPAAMQITAEMAVFAVATALVARLDPVSLAAHQIALNAASFTFMVPLGVGSAAAVRVGQALGRGDPKAASRAGWTALFLGSVFMSCSTLAFLLVPRYIVRIFSPDPAVMKMGVSLLAVAALFQLFDGFQVVATGALRGAGDTRTPMLSHLLTYWLLGLPLGYFLCFWWGWGAAGLWAGLCVALIFIGLLLVCVWQCRVRAFAGISSPSLEVMTKP
jgi:MATE family multidrug resistance protein